MDKGLIEQLKRIMRYSVFPKLSKTAIVISLPKKSILANRRPISLLSGLRNIIEKIIQNRITQSAIRIPGEVIRGTTNHEPRD
ncbi:hypothetical protein Trydic_g19071 [Trypoxylus dichotomus]